MSFRHRTTILAVACFVAACGSTPVDEPITTRPPRPAVTAPTAVGTPGSPTFAPGIFLEDLAVADSYAQREPTLTVAADRWIVPLTLFSGEQQLISSLLISLDPSTGIVHWSDRTEPGTRRGCTLADGSLLCLSATAEPEEAPSEAAFVRLDPTTGEQLSAVEIEADGSGVALWHADGAVAVIAGQANGATAFDTTTGAQLWTYPKLHPQQSLWLPLDDRTALVPRGLDADGTWLTPVIDLTTGTALTTDLAGIPISFGSTVCVGPTYSGADPMICLKPDGTPAWTSDDRPGNQWPKGSDGRFAAEAMNQLLPPGFPVLTYSDQSRVLTAHDPATGTTRWTTPVAAWSTHAVGPDLVLVLGEGLSGYSAATGEPVAVPDLDDSAHLMTLTDHSAVFLDDDGLIGVPSGLDSWTLPRAAFAPALEEGAQPTSVLGHADGLTVLGTAAGHPVLWVGR